MTLAFDIPPSEFIPPDTPMANAYSPALHPPLLARPSSFPSTLAADALSYKATISSRCHGRLGPWLLSSKRKLFFSLSSALQTTIFSRSTQRNRSTSTTTRLHIDKHARYVVQHFYFSVVVLASRLVRRPLTVRVGGCGAFVVGDGEDFVGEGDWDLSFGSGEMVGGDWVRFLGIGLASGRDIWQPDQGD